MRTKAPWNRGVESAPEAQLDERQPSHEVNEEVEPKRGGKRYRREPERGVEEAMVPETVVDLLADAAGSDTEVFDNVDAGPEEDIKPNINSSNSSSSCKSAPCLRLYHNSLFAFSGENLAERVRKNQHASHQVRDGMLQLVLNDGLSPTDYQTILNILSKQELENQMRTLQNVLSQDVSGSLAVLQVTPHRHYLG